MKKLKLTLLLLLMTLSLLIGVGFIFSTKYEDEVKAYLIEQINMQIDTKVDVKEVHFSIFKKFPYASLEFKKVITEEVSNSVPKGILFSAESIYLQLNIIDILRKNYIIRKIDVENGIVNIRIDKNGKDNYHFWKKNNTNSDSTPLNIELDNLVFKEVTFYFLNEYKNMDMAIEAIDLSLSGNFSANNYTLQTKSELFVHQINNKNKTLLKDRDITINTSLAVNQETANYTIKKGRFSISNLNFNLSGNIQEKENGFLLNIFSKGSNLKITELFSLFPKQQQFLEHYKSQGKIDYSSSVTGIYSAQKSPFFSVDFNISGAQIEEKSSNKSLTNLNLTGNYTNGENHNLTSSVLILKKLDASFGAGHISGSCVITNFLDPYIDVKSEATIDLEMAKDFFKFDTLENASGNIEIDLHYRGNIEELNNIKAKEFPQLDVNGIVHLNKLNLKLIDNPLELQNINGIFKFNNSSVRIDTLELMINKNDVKLNGVIKNLLAYLFVKDQYLYIQANTYSSKLNLDNLLNYNSKNNNNSPSTSNTSYLPEKLSLSLISKIDTFNYRKFKASNFKGYIHLNEKKLSAKNIYLNTMNGYLEGNIVFDNSKEKRVFITSNTTLKNIDINELFMQFENFSQNYILDKNLKGKVNSTIEFAGIWDEKFNLDKDKMYVNANLTITDGELINYKPILAMSKFIEVEELEQIKFYNLNTKISIKDQIISIPKTEIKSSAIDLTISGKHTFNNEIDYRFKLSMGDLLWRKAKERKKENIEFGYIEDDNSGKTNLFLSMIGTVDDYKLKYDTKGLRDNWKKNFKQEKTTLKEVLNKEFGWFKKDTSLKKQKEVHKDPFIFEWEDEDEKTNTKKKVVKTKTKSPKKDKKGLGKFIDKIAQPDAEEYEENNEF